MQKNTLVSNTLLSFSSEFIPLIVGIFTIPSIIHGLGTARFGVLSLVWVFTWYFGIFDFGLGRANTKYVSEAIGSGDQNKIPQLIWTAIIAQTVISVLGIILLIAITPFVVNYVLNIPNELVRETTNTCYTIAFMIPIVMVTATLKGVLEAAQRFDMVAFVKIPASLSTYILSLAGVYLGLRLDGIITLLLISRFVILLIYFNLNIHIYPKLKETISFHFSILRSFLVFGGWATVSNVVGPIVGYLERFLITYFLSIEALSYYAAPADMTSRLVLIPMSMATVLFPAFSSIGMNNRPKLVEMFSRPLKYLLFVMTPILVTLVTFAHPILQLWLGSEFAKNGTLPLQILAICIFLNAFAYIPYTTIHGLGKPEFKAKLDLIELPLYIGLNIWLIPALGITGAAVAKLIITIIDLLALFVIAKHYVRLLLTEMFPRKLRYGLGISFLLISSALLVRYFNAPLYVDILLICSLLIMYLVLFLKLSMDNLDWSAMRGLFRPHMQRSLNIENIHDRT
jgi:O-antigen/teichoic acid export membrane protein